MASINVVHIVDFVVMMPLGPQLMRIFEISPHQFGLLVSSYTFAAGVSGLLASLGIDRFDRKSALLFFVLGFATGTLACALSPSYELLLLARSLTGAFGGVLSSLVLSIVSDAISIERRGTAMGIVMGSFSIASIAGVPFSLYLANHLGWHAPYLFLALLAGLVAVLIYTLMPKMADHLKGARPSTDLFFSIKHVLASPNQVAALVFIFSLVFGQFCIIPFISPSLVANGGLTEQQLPLLYLVGGLVSMVASPTFGRLSDIYGKKKIFYIAAFFSIGPIYTITHLGPNSLAVLLAVSSSFFLAMSGRMVPAMALVTSTATPKFRASFMSLNSSTQQLSMALASLLAGYVVVEDQLGHLVNFELVGYLAIGFTLIASFLMRRIVVTEGSTSLAKVP